MTGLQTRLQTELLDFKVCFDNKKNMDLTNVVVTKNSNSNFKEILKKVLNSTSVI